MLEVAELTRNYNGHTAVDSVSFTLEKGRIYGLLGPNGAGKSTTMNMMTGYIAPSGGQVSIMGHDIYKEAKEAKRHIGYLPENPPVYPDMTVHEYLVFVAELKGVSKDEKMLAVESVMEDCGVNDVSDRLIKNLSKGYKQRVGLAGALLSQPDVLILDEPTVGLDPKQILEFRSLIRDYANDHAVLISSHILSEIEAICDHVFIIADGRLVLDEDTENLHKDTDESLEEIFLELTDKVEELLKEAEPAEDTEEAAEAEIEDPEAEPVEDVEAAAEAESDAEETETEPAAEDNTEEVEQ